MTTWRQGQSVLAEVLGLVRREGRVLLGKVEDSASRLKGLRALGESIEFGQTCEQALAREFMEELGGVVRTAGPRQAWENIVEREGATGHEDLFVAAVEVVSPLPPSGQRVPYNEADGASCHAGWFDPGDPPDGAPLFPAALVVAIAPGESGGQA